MYLTPQQAAEVFAKLRTLEVIRKYWGLTEVQLQHPECGVKLVECFDNLKQPAELLKRTQLAKEFPTTPPLSIDVPSGGVPTDETR